MSKWKWFLVTSFSLAMVELFGFVAWQEGLSLKGSSSPIFAIFLMATYGVLVPLAALAMLWGLSGNTMAFALRAFAASIAAISAVCAIGATVSISHGDYLTIEQLLVGYSPMCVVGTLLYLSNRAEHRSNVSLA